MPRFGEGVLSFPQLVHIFSTALYIAYPQLINMPFSWPYMAACCYQYPLPYAMAWLTTTYAHR